MDKRCINCKNRLAGVQFCRDCVPVVERVGGHTWIPSLWESNEIDNPYWKNVCDLADKQRAKGIATYGQGLEDNPMEMEERLTYLQEELIDGLMYIEHIKAKLHGMGAVYDQ